MSIPLRRERLIAVPRTRSAPDAHAIRGSKPRRGKKSKPLAARASQKPRKHKNQQRKASALTDEQLIQEVLFLRGQVAALVKENEAMKVLLGRKQVPLPLWTRKKAA